MGNLLSQTYKVESQQCDCDQQLSSDEEEAQTKSRDKLKCGFNRDSFDRFGSDLTQVIVSYLPLEDKIRFECVSKIWKYTVYNRQYELDIRDILVVIEERNDYNDIIFKTAIEISLKKLKNLNHITIGLFSCDDRGLVDINVVSYDWMLRLIADDCKYLTSIKLFSDRNSMPSENILTYFGSKCGQQLCKINITIFKNDNLNFMSLLNWCPSLSSLKLEVYDMQSSIKTNLMRYLAENCANTVNTLEIKDLFDEENCMEVSQYVSKLINLEKLLISASVSINLVQCIQLIETNCKRLTHLQFDFVYLSLQRHDYNTVLHIFQALNTFNNLESFCIKFMADCNTETSSMFPKLFVCCENLTHLHISLYDSRGITDDYLKCFAQIRKLKTLVINENLTPHSNSLITDDGICAIIENCPNIRKLKFYPKPNITHKTINLLIKTAVNRPEHSFVFAFYSSNAQNRSLLSKIADCVQFLKIHALFLVKNVPKNLVVVYN